MESNMLPIILLGIMLLFGGVFFIITKKKNNSNNTSPNQNTSPAQPKAVKTEDVKKEDVFKFMNFDKIQNDMIIQENGGKYTAVINCKGINYNLMSEVEQMAVEEGFINFLNTLKFPIQLYVQAQNINLSDNISKYKENMKEFYERYDDINTEYNMLVNSLDSTDEEIAKVELEKSSALNVLEYGQDIIRYVERLSLNKNLLQRNFFILISYYKSEITNASTFNKEEILDICYTELFTRVQNVISALSMSSVPCSIMTSNEIAELLYSAYNRDDKNYISVKQALESGFHRLYSTSKDAIAKKHERLLDSIKKEAEYKAIMALANAVDGDELVTEEDAEDYYDQESSKQAIEMIKNEKVDTAIKEKAKKQIVEDYKTAKKERLQKKEERLSKIKENYGTGKANSPAENESSSDELTEEVNVDTTPNDDNESVV